MQPDIPARGCSDDSSAQSVRAQANLIALVAALVVLSTVTVMAVAFASGALADADRETAERHAAATVGDRLVAPSSPLTERANVIDAGAIDDLSGSRLRARYPILTERAFSVRLGERTLASAGDPRSGARMSRIVFVERAQTYAFTPRFDGTNALTLPRRTPRARLDIEPPSNITVRAVRANQRTVLRDPAGLDGSYEIDLSRRETARLVLVADGELSRGDVSVTLYPRRVRKSQLTVIVDA